MTDPFSDHTLNNGSSDGITHCVHNIRYQMERAIEAYRRNIALPDVHIASRSDRSIPPSVGEDGEEMTFERRQQLMQGKQTMCDESGRVRGIDPRIDENNDYLHAFDNDIHPERLGKSAEDCRHQLRIVQPKVLELDFEIDDQMLEEAAPAGVPSLQRCVYTSGQNSVFSVETLHQHGEAALRSIYKESGELKLAPHRVYMSLPVWAYLADLTRHHRDNPMFNTIWHTRIHIDVANDMDLTNEIRLVTDVAKANRYSFYASLFVARKFYESYKAKSETTAIINKQQ